MNVEPSAVRQFAHAVRAADPVHYGDQPLTTPTFLMSSAWWQGPENAAWGDQERDLSRVLHGEQEFVFHGEPPTAGAELEGVARIDRTYTKQGRRGGEMIFTDVVTEFRDVHTGRLVAEVRTTSIETGRAVTDEKEGR
jgi:hypothetical protein